MSPELPRDMTGVRVTMSTPYTPSFNDTIPTEQRPASNLVSSWASLAFVSSFQGPWIRGEPLQRIVIGCPEKCRAQIHAPTLFRTSCTTHETAINYLAPWYHVRNNLIAVPLDQQSFLVATNLVLREKEVINLITGYTSSQYCDGSLRYTICTLEHGIGEYEVLVAGNSTTLVNPSAPKLVALANNTAVSDVMDPTGTGHLSTLAGIVDTFTKSLNGYVY